MNKRRKTFSLSNSVVEVIERFANEEADTQSVVVENAVRFYAENKTEGLKKVQDGLKSLEKKVDVLKIIGNASDKQLQMTMEFWNHLFAYNDHPEFASTENFVTKELKGADELITKRIQKAREKKYNRG